MLVTFIILLFVMVMVSLLLMIATLASEAVSPSIGVWWLAINAVGVTTTGFLMAIETQRRADRRL